MQSLHFNQPDKSAIINTNQLKPQWTVETQISLTLFMMLTLSRIISKKMTKQICEIKLVKKASG